MGTAFWIWSIAVIALALTLYKMVRDNNNYHRIEQLLYDLKARQLSGEDYAVFPGEVKLVAVGIGGDPFPKKYYFAVNKNAWNSLTDDDRSIMVDRLRIRYTWAVSLQVKAV